MSKDKNIHIMSHEQAVCRRDTEMEKAYFLNVGNIAMYLCHSLLGSEIRSPLFKEQG